VEQINIQGKGRTNQDKVSSTIFKRPIYGAYNITSPIRLRHESFWTRSLHSQSLLRGPPFCLKALILSNAGAPSDPAHRTSKTGALFGFIAHWATTCVAKQWAEQAHTHTPTLTYIFVCSKAIAQSRHRLQLIAECTPAHSQTYIFVYICRGGQLRP